MIQRGDKVHWCDPGCRVEHIVHSIDDTEITMVCGVFYPKAKVSAGPCASHPDLPLHKTCIAAANVQK